MSQGEQLFSDGPRSEGGSLSCEQARRQIERLIEESDLKDFERSLLMSHVRNCPSCKAELECYRRAEVRLKEAFAGLDTAPNFNERLMAALPSPGTPDSPEWIKNLRVRDRAPTTRQAPMASTRMLLRKRSILRAYWLPISMSAIIGLALAVTWYRTHGREGDAPPRVAQIIGEAWRLKQGGAEIGLRKGDPLNSADVIRSGSAPVTLTLTSADKLIGNLVLAANSKLVANNRHVYQVREGAVYFQVEKNRPKNREDEYFEVEAGTIATVRVTGTSFIVDVADTRGAKVEKTAVVSVEEGLVEVRTPSMGSTTQVAANKELLISETRSPVLTDSDVNQRLNHVRQSLVSQGAGPASGQPVKVAGGSSSSTPSVVKGANPVSAPFNWDVKVRNVALAGKSLAAGIDLLSETLENGEALKKLSEELRGPGITNTQLLSFSVHSEMPLRSVLAWMARDAGWGFEIGADGRGPYFITPPRAETVGAAGPGIPPEEIRSALDTPYAQNIPLGSAISDVVDLLSKCSGVTMILERPAAAISARPIHWPENFNSDALLNVPGQSVMQKLDTILEGTHLSCAWYDHALYIAAPSHIESLTFVERDQALNPQTLGEPASPQRLAELRELLALQKFPNDTVSISGTHLRLSHLYADGALSGKPLFAGLAIDGATLRYKSGILGAAFVNSLVSTLATESPTVPSVAGMLSQQCPRDPISDMESLIALARTGLGRIDSSVRFPALNQAFVFKNMTLGESLEWAVWACGYGLKLEKNAVVIDEVSRCYGAPAMQVLALNSLADKRAELAQELPQMFKRLLPALYPSMFANVEFRVFGGKLIFTGDRRHLQLAQRLRGDLERALEAGAAFNSQIWLPPARTAVEGNYRTTFKDGIDKLSTRTFAGMLRQSALTSQLSASVLVDPAAMKEHKADPIPDLNVAGLSIGKVLEQIAAHANLKVTIEGDVIWLRSAK